MLPLPSTQRICHERYQGVEVRLFRSVSGAQFPIASYRGLKTDIKTVKYLDLTSRISRSAEAEFGWAVRSGELEVREAGGVSHLAIRSDKRISQHLSGPSRPSLSAKPSFRLSDLPGPIDVRDKS